MENEVSNSPAPDVSLGASSTPEASTESVNTPPVENMGSEGLGSNSGSNAIPYGRFKEVIDQKNEYAQRMEAMERRLSAYETSIVQNKAHSAVEATVSKLVAAGLDANAAKLLIETQNELMESRFKERLDPIEQRNSAYEVKQWINSFSSTHKDYNAIEPHMERAFANLPQAQQNFVAGSPQGLEMLYWKVKGELANQMAPGQRQAGINQAYQTMGQKAAMSSTPGSAPVKAALSRESISKMDANEYAARRSEIMDAMSKGLVK